MSLFSYNRVLKRADYKTFGVNTRKGWEIYMALKTLRELRVTHPSAKILGVGAGKEATIFHLANRYDASLVMATDIYEDPGVWKDWHGVEFLRWPAWFSPAGVHFDTERIQAEHHDMRNLPEEWTERWDGVFSSGSIEHVGEPGKADYAAIQQAAREIGRVLVPGGVASISTEWRISGEGWGWANVHLFDEQLIMEHIVEPSGLELIGEPDWSFDGDPNRFVRLLDIVQKTASEEGHVLIADAGFTFTSVHLALRKPE